MRRTGSMAGVSLLFTAALFALGSAGAQAGAADVRIEGEPKRQASIDPSFGRMSRYFVENRGQLDGRVGYYLQGQTAAYFTGDGITYAFSKPSRSAHGRRGPGAAPTRLAVMTAASELPEPPEAKRWAVAIDLVGARRPLWPEGDDQTPTIVSYFKGPKEQWKVALPTYQTVAYRNIWPGIDLDYTVKSGQMKYTFVVQPGADPRAIKLRYRGAASAAVVDGELLVQTPLGGIRDQKPVVYQEGAPGCREEVAARHTLRRDGADYVASFKLGPYDHSRPLVVDPVVLAYCGYIGGSREDYGLDVAVDAAGSAYVTGRTYSPETSFPVTVGPDLTFNNPGGGETDAFVAKVRADGTGLVYAGYIGGVQRDGGESIAVDAAGNAYVTGITGSDETSFPLIVGPDLKFFNGAFFNGAFVAKVKADGTGLVYAGYIPGTVGGIAVDQAGSAYTIGDATQSTFPVIVGPDFTYNGGLRDAFVAKVRADGSGLVYAGYIGGDDSDSGVGIAVDAAGFAYVTGSTSSREATFPIFAGPDLTYNGGLRDAFVAKVRADGTGLGYAGYIGGAGSGSVDSLGIAVDAAGNAYITGATVSDETSLPVSVGPDLSFNGGADGFVAKVRPDGSDFDYLGYIGGAGNDSGGDIAVDAAGNAYVTGITRSSEMTFPVTLGPDLTYNGLADVFVAKVREDGTGLVYAGYLGGRNEDNAYGYGGGIALDSAGDAYIAGITESSESTFPVTVGPDLTFNGSYETFVAKVRHCLLGNLAPMAMLRGVKTANASGARFEWAQDPRALEYHLNTVLAKVDLRETDPTSPRQLPVGAGVTQCTAFGPTLSCTDSDAIVDPQTLLFYQVLSACGSSGTDEGPVCSAAAPCL